METLLSGVEALWLARSGEYGGHRKAEDVQSEKMDLLKEVMTMISRDSTLGREREGTEDTERYFTSWSANKLRKWIRRKKMRSEAGMLHKARHGTRSDSSMRPQGTEGGRIQKAQKLLEE